MFGQTFRVPEIVYIAYNMGTQDLPDTYVCSCLQVCGPWDWAYTYHIYLVKRRAYYYPCQMRPLFKGGYYSRVALIRLKHLACGYYSIIIIIIVRRTSEFKCQNVVSTCTATHISCSYLSYMCWLHNCMLFVHALATHI